MEEVKDVPTKTKVVRITYCDPDATDSSSSDDDNDYYYYNPLYFDPSQDVIKYPKKKPHKKIVLQINLDPNLNSSSPIIMRKFHLPIANAAPNTVLPIGVRNRKSGRYGAEVRDPFTKKRIWLGTFETPKEASRAYVLKKAEIEKEKMKRMAMKMKVGDLGSANSSSVQMNGSDLLTGDRDDHDKEDNVDSYVSPEKGESFGENMVDDGGNHAQVVDAWTMDEFGNDFVHGAGFSDLFGNGGFLP